jgi:ABC-type multidrug transport system permease subunit
LTSNLIPTLRVIRALGARSVKQTFRRPQLLAPIIIFPSLLLAVQTGGASSATHLPGFPHVHGFLDFMLAGAMIQSALLASNSGGIALAVDIEMGFTDRLLAAPVPRFAIVLGRLAATAALGAFSATYFVVLGLVFGAHINDGIWGALLVIVLITLSAVALGGIGAAIALRTGSASVVQGLFPLVFVILFMSSAFFPADLILEPAKAVAKYNPISFIAEAAREPIAFSVTGSAVVKGFLSIGGIAAFSVWLSNRALQARLRRG